MGSQTTRRGHLEDPHGFSLMPETAQNQLFRSKIEFFYWHSSCTFRFRRKFFGNATRVNRSFFRGVKQKVVREKIYMSELSTNDFSNPEASAEKNNLDLIEVMEIFSTICVTHPIRLMEILETCAGCLSEDFRESSMAEFMSLKQSAFGRRMTLIH